MNKQGYDFPFPHQPVTILNKAVQSRTSQHWSPLSIAVSRVKRGDGLPPPSGISKADTEVVVQVVASQCSNSLPLTAQYQQEHGEAELPSLSDIN